jgi:hypothetical protein
MQGARSPGTLQPQFSPLCYAKWDSCTPTHMAGLLGGHPRVVETLVAPDSAGRNGVQGLTAVSLSGTSVCVSMHWGGEPRACPGKGQNGARCPGARSVVPHPQPPSSQGACGLHPIWRSRQVPKPHSSPGTQSAHTSSSVSCLWLCLGGLPVPFPC